MQDWIDRFCQTTVPVYFLKPPKTVLFGPLPRFQGIIMFRSSLLDEFKLKSSGRGWAVLMELIIRTKRARRRMKSLPTEMRPRRSGVSKVNNIATISENLKQVIALRGLL